MCLGSCVCKSKKTTGRLTRFSWKDVLGGLNTLPKMPQSRQALLSQVAAERKLLRRGARKPPWEQQKPKPAPSSGPGSAHSRRDKGPPQQSSEAEGPSHPYKGPEACAQSLCSPWGQDQEKVARRRTRPSILGSFLQTCMQPVNGA